MKLLGMIMEIACNRGSLTKYPLCLIIFIAINGIMAQTTSNNSKKMNLGGDLLKSRIENFSDFKKISSRLAVEKFGSPKFRTLYVGEQLSFLGHKVSEFGIYVRNSKVQDFRFELPYSDHKIFDDLISHFGMPYTIIPKEPPYLNASRNFDYYKNYGLENCLEISWHTEGNEYYVNLDNLVIANSCYPSKVGVIWITFRTLKE